MSRVIKASQGKQVNWSKGNDSQENTSKPVTALNSNSNIASMFGGR